MPPVERVLNVTGSPDRDRDYRVSRARGEGLLDGTPTPDVVDLRAGRAWYQVRDQEETGSCVGWALGDSVLRWQLVEHGRIDPDQHVSARFIWMAAKEVRAKLAPPDDPRWRPGTALERAYTSLKAGLEVARWFGVALEGEVPWRGGLYCGDVDSFYAAAATRRVRNYFSLDEPDPTATIQNWREWLNEQGPILVKLDVDDRFERGTRDVLDRFDPAAIRDGHAAALVGYTADAFVVRSSWGTDWGTDGYLHVTYPYALGAVRESYGVVL